MINRGQIKSTLVKKSQETVLSGKHGFGRFLWGFEVGGPWVIFGWTQLIVAKVSSTITQAGFSAANH